MKKYSKEARKEKLMGLGRIPDEDLCTPEEELEQKFIHLTDPSSTVRVLDLQDMIDGNQIVLGVTPQGGREFFIGKDDLDQLEQAYPDSFPNDQILDLNGEIIQNEGHPQTPDIDTDRINTNTLDKPVQCTPEAKDEQLIGNAGTLSTPPAGGMGMKT